MVWNRRRDLEGGKEIGVWLADDGRELYVEDLTYRQEGYSVFVRTPDGDWEEKKSTGDSEEAFEAALELVEDKSSDTLSEG